jgi:hypothetical protein
MERGNERRARRLSPGHLRRVPSQARRSLVAMSISTRDDRSVEAVSYLLSLGLTQLSIQATLSTSLTLKLLHLA